MSSEAMDAGMPLMAARGLSLWAGERVLLQGFDWQLHPGQRWCVIGRNAVGKSMLLRALAGLPVPRQAGCVEWAGVAARDWSAASAARMRALLPQSAQDRFSMSVRRLLALCEGPGADPMGVAQALDVSALMTRDIRQLSGGERQRLGLAQCAVQGARVMLLDEPVAFQDPAHQLSVARWLCGMPAEALVASAHDINWVARVATHVLALQDAGAWAAGAADAILRPDVLQAVYGCVWRCVGGVWTPDA